MDVHSAKLFLSAVTVAEIEDGIAKLRREGATHKATDLMAWLEALLHLYGNCQSARKKDPRSACKRDPLFSVVFWACPGSEQGGTRARRGAAYASDETARVGVACLPTWASWGAVSCGS